MTHGIEKRRSITAGAVAYLLLLALCIALINPFVNTGISDDFSFIRSAKDFADTGRFIYNGWSSPILGWMIPFGALFIKLFGFSFTNVRIASFVIAAANGLLVQWILLRLGCTRWLALLGATAVLLSPISLPETVIFFTDQPGLLALLVTLALCIRILRAGSPRATQLWILLAFFASFFLGTARQLLWLCTLIMVPSTVWLVRKRKRVLPWSAGCFALAAAAIAATMHWWNHQPYSLSEALIQHYPLSAWARYLILPAIELLVTLAPVMSLFLFRRASAVRHAIEAVVALLTLLIMSRNPHDLLRVGSHDIFGNAPQWIFLITLSYSLALTTRVVPIIHQRRTTGRPQDEDASLNLFQLSVLVVPFAIVFYILSATRETFFARYLLPLMAVLTMWLIKFWRDDPIRKTSHTLVPALLVIFYCAFPIVDMHDQFRGAEAILSLTKWYTAQKMPRNLLEAGFAFDGWYQVEQSGYINEPRIKIPAGAYVPHPFPPNIAVCHNFFLPDTPSIHPIYSVGASLSPCFVGPALHTVTYHTWEAPHQRSLFIARLAPQYALPPQ